MTDARRTFDTSGQGDLRLTVNTAYFPGWTIRIDGTRAPVRARPGDAYMEVNVPRGTHHVEATFDNTPLRSRANVVTIVAAGLTLLMVVAGAAPLGRRLRGAERPREARVPTTV
jgi:uncharacterized membrane protein YfhO